MNIIGPDALVFGVDDLAACSQYLIDYGLKDVGAGRFEALDGTAVIVHPKDAPGLPPPLGTASLLRLKLRRHPLHGDPAQAAMDLGFIALLFLTSATGLLLWALRGHAQMALALSLHLGCVMALFATLPYNKFAHGIFRTASLLRYAVEKRQPNRLGLGGE